jgi:hypothetical protein
MFITISSTNHHGGPKRHGLYLTVEKKKCEGLQIIEDPYNLVVMFSRKDRAHFL